MNLYSVTYIKNYFQIKSTKNNNHLLEKLKIIMNVKKN